MNGLTDRPTNQIMQLTFPISVDESERIVKMGRIDDM